MRKLAWSIEMALVIIGAALVLMTNNGGALIAADPAATATPAWYSYLPLVLKNFCSGPGCPPTPVPPTPTPTPVAGQVTLGEVVAWYEDYGGWTFVGLVANGTTANVSGLRVFVDLKNAGGQVVETLVAEVPAWRLKPQGWGCWKAITFSSWVTYTARVGHTVSGTSWPDVQMMSASLSLTDWPTVTGQARNNGPGAAHDLQVSAWLRSNGILADCISEILSPNPLPAGSTGNFTLYASRNLTGTVTLGGTNASGRPAP